MRFFPKLPVFPAVPSQRNGTGLICILKSFWSNNLKRRWMMSRTGETLNSFAILEKRQHFYLLTLQCISRKTWGKVSTRKHTAFTLFLGEKPTSALDPKSSEYWLCNTSVACPVSKSNRAAPPGRRCRYHILNAKTHVWCRNSCWQTFHRQKKSTEVTVDFHELQHPDLVREYIFIWYICFRAFFFFLKGKHDSGSYSYFHSIIPEGDYSLS